MKIEFIKEERIDDDIFYYTKVDGKFVNNSLSYSLETAKQRYNFIVEKKQITPVETILESIDVNL